jgi:hypothetical protein
MSGRGEFDAPDVQTEDDADKAWVMDCGDPNCCMNFAPHFRHECYTPEMYEAMLAEQQSDRPEGQEILAQAEVRHGS